MLIGGDIRTRVYFQLLPYKKFYFVCWPAQFTNVEVEVMYSGKNTQSKHSMKQKF